MAVDHIAESSRRNAASASNDEGAPKSGRVVFLAQPARDMEQAYMRLATEFRGRGYGVAPDPRSGIFNGRAAEQFVDQALNGAEFSVHLIGAEETPDRIVAMQLARARDRAGAAKAAGATMLFRRMIWAPRIFQAGGAVVERDPLHVLDRFDQQIATDKIEGGIIGNFIEYLFQYLAEAAPLPTARKRAPPASRWRARGAKSAAGLPASSEER